MDGGAPNYGCRPLRNMLRERVRGDSFCTTSDFSWEFLKGSRYRFEKLGGYGIRLLHAIHSMSCHATFMSDGFPNSFAQVRCCHAKSQEAWTRGGSTRQSCWGGRSDDAGVNSGTTSRTVCATTELAAS